MKSISITKVFRFDSAHHLPSHKGKCARLHGHSYRLEVTLQGPIKNDPRESDHGMIMDFGDLSQIVKTAVIERLDHQDLNIITNIYTTAENLVLWIWEELINNGLDESLLYRIRLWETDSSFVELVQQEHP